ncbi:MAG: histidine--tRNA ligase [Clostridia bacterium]|nr:histidine--tRNA ligase [Clostridia bacterium]
MLTNIPKGTKDLMQDESYKWQFLENKFAEFCALYGFKEIRTPIFEHTELFQRGIGDTTDVVQKEMYTFEDHGHRSITLKPEGTAGAVRAFLEHKIYAETQPTKLFYKTPCFRYEKPQSGRLRQFHQFGVEVFGASNMIADAEVISLAYKFIKYLGIEDLELHINSIGCPECRAKYRLALQEFLRPKFDELCPTCQSRFDRNPMRILDCKSEICQDLVKGAPVMIDYLCDDCKEAFEDLQADLKALDIDFTIDTGIVRGLDYYTKTAFEFVTNSIGAQGTVCGGGRYDNLVEELGGPSVPGVGWGMGIERLLMVMEANGIEIPKPSTSDVFVATMGENAKHYGLKLVSQLRDNGIKADLDTLQRNFKGQFKYSDRIGAKYTVVIGDNELETKLFQVKDMDNSTQYEVKEEELIQHLVEKVNA